MKDPARIYLDYDAVSHEHDPEPGCWFKINEPEPSSHKTAVSIFEKEVEAFLLASVLEFFKLKGDRHV